ncbi:Mitochondrial inner membrane protease subunit 2 [Bulinus truncatus]|nr:Mitochondrial inner membrane protease subunit 2 [Bulinus truncatus]
MIICDGCSVQTDMTICDGCSVQTDRTNCDGCSRWCGEEGKGWSTQCGIFKESAPGAVYTRDASGGGQSVDVFTQVSPKDPSQWLIKRVVALEGDQVKADSCFEEVVDVPKGHCWVEGDNRRCSMDSNNFGPVSMGLITAKATHVIWPPSRWGRLDKKEITGERVTLRENTDRGRVFFGWE